MTAVFEQVFILLIFALIGYTLGKTRVVDADKTKLLSALEFYVFLPSVAFNTFSTRFTVFYLKEKYLLILISIGLLLIISVMASLIAPLLHKDPYQRRVYKYSLTVPNYGYIGYALTESLFGSAVLMDMMIFVLPLALYTYTVGYALLTNQTDKKHLAKQLLNPSLIAVCLGSVFGLTGLTVRSVLSQVLQKSAACMSPVSMLLIGIVISQFQLKELLLNKRSYFICAMRLLIIPAIVFLLLKITGLQIAITTAVITYCLPCGSNPIVYGKLTGQDCKTGASLSLLSTILALLTIPLCVHFFIG